MQQAQAQGLPPATTGDITPEPVREGIDLIVNGERFRHTGDPLMPLLWYLRDVLRLTGTKVGGMHGEGGYDLVLVNGKAVSAIKRPMAKLVGARVTPHGALRACSRHAR